MKKFKDLLFQSLYLFKKSFWLTIPLAILSSYCDQKVISRIEDLLSNPEGSIQKIYWYGGLSLMNSILFPMLLTSILICTYKYNSRFWLLPWFRQLNILLIESFRAFGKVIFYSLLILPGIYKYFSVLFVPHIVLLDPDYEKGSLDSLEASKKRVFQSFKPILFLIILGQIVIPFLFTAFDEYHNFTLSFWKAATMSIVDLLLQFIVSVLLLNVFLQSVPDKQEKIV